MSTHRCVICAVQEKSLLAAPIRLDLRTSNPLNNSQGFSKGATMAAARERKKQRSMVLHRLSIARDGIEALPVTVTMTRVAPSSGLDFDGLTAALKSVRDGVADYYAVNDRDERIDWRYEQRRGRPHEYAVTIRIERRLPR